jgi:hypothetical protein
VNMSRHIEMREPYEDPEPEAPSRSDIALMGRALRRGWVADDEKRAKILELLYDVALDPETRDRSRIGAVKAILAAERVAVAWQDAETKKQIADKTTGTTQVNILAVAAELGDGLDDRSGEDDPGLPGPLPE